ncbi:MAG TPA: imelysin family protein [Amaricoccus sp.]|nr:imelysin family protein [Amaricoccus sp.]
MHLRLVGRGALAAALLAAPAAAQTTDHAAMAQRALERHILPGFERLNAAAVALDTAAKTACAGEGPIDAGPLKVAYGEAFDAWAGIQHIRFGPAEEDNNGFGIEFWPDTKGSTPRTLAALVKDEDPNVDDAAAFAKESVAARGLMALDQLLYDPAAAPIEAGSYGCRLVEAITADMVATTARMLGRWRDPWGGFLTSAGAADNPVYLAPEESTKALYSALSDGLQADIDLRLGRPLGTFDKPQPRRAEAWRSGRSLPNLLASVAGMQALFETVFAPAIGADDAQVVRNSLDGFANAAANVAAPIDVEVATPQGRIHVEALQTALGRVQTEVASHVGPVVGVTSGFNAMDGD